MSHTEVIWHDLTDPIPSWSSSTTRARGVQNFRLLVPVVLEPESPSYARWRDLILLTLHRYTLDDHVLIDASVAVQTPSWLRLDSIMLSWILGTISLSLHDLVHNSADARRAWLALEGQFLGNAEARALHLDASFRTFVQGNLSISDFCRRMKGMADSLDDLGWPMEDRILASTSSTSSVTATLTSGRGSPGSGPSPPSYRSVTTLSWRSSLRASS